MLLIIKLKSHLFLWIGSLAPATPIPLSPTLYLLYIFIYGLHFTTWTTQKRACITLHHSVQFTAKKKSRTKNRFLHWTICFCCVLNGCMSWYWQSCPHTYIDNLHCHGSIRSSIECFGRCWFFCRYISLKTACHGASKSFSIFSHSFHSLVVHSIHFQIVSWIIIWNMDN